MKSNNSSFYKVIVTANIFLLLLGCNFMSAAWDAPTGPPPTNNADAPINVGPQTQNKFGSITSSSSFIADQNIAGNKVGAFTKMLSPLYCDENGENCNSFKVNYTEYAKDYCGFTGASFVSSLVDKNGLYLALIDTTGWTNTVSSESLKWRCEGPNAAANYEINRDCGLTIISTSQYSIFRNPTENRLWDKDSDMFGGFDHVKIKDGTSVPFSYHPTPLNTSPGTSLEFSCNSTNLQITKIQTECGLSVRPEATSGYDPNQIDNLRFILKNKIISYTDFDRTSSNNGYQHQTGFIKWSCN